MVAALMGGFVTAASALTTNEAASILYLKQEEKMARDVYRALQAKWGHRKFINISASEQQHMDALDTLIVRYRLTDTTPAAPGRFTIPEIQALHDKLVARGIKSLKDAMEVGVLVEKTDIADLKKAINATQDPSIRTVYGNLLRASNNHLAAFTRSPN
jgi:hypothetical protein